MGGQQCRPREDNCALCAVASGPESEVALPNQGGLKVGNSLGFLDAATVKNTLPKELSASSVAIIKETAPLLARSAEAIGAAFYRRILESHLELFEFFNLANQRSGRQTQAFAAALCAFADAIEDPQRFRPAIDLIAAKHCALCVQPHHYLIIHEVMMHAVEEVFGPAMTPAVGVGWSEAILFLSGMLVEREEELYAEAKARNGGWRGFRRFVVARRERVAQDVMMFTLKPADARGVYFDFAPGQFVSVKVDVDAVNPTAPRHYTVTSPPGMPYLQICVKRLEGGKVSNYLHMEATDGQEVLLSPPFGTFTARLRDAGGVPPTAVLISAGIGVTPMLALLPELGQKVLYAAHVDRSEESFTCRERFMEVADRVGAVVLVHYTRHLGRPAKDFAANIAKRVGLHHDFYVCGPSSFMVDVMRSLADCGVDAERIQFEVFGPQLCPAHEAGGPAISSQTPRAEIGHGNGAGGCPYADPI